MTYHHTPMKMAKIKKMTATPAARGRSTSLLPDEGESPGSPGRHCGEFILTPGNRLPTLPLFVWVGVGPQFFLWCLTGVHGYCLNVFHLARLPFFCSVVRAGRLLLGLLSLSIGFSDLPASLASVWDT